MASLILSTSIQPHVLPFVQTLRSTDRIRVERNNDTSISLSADHSEYSNCAPLAITIFLHCSTVLHLGLGEATGPKSESLQCTSNMTSLMRVLPILTALIGSGGFTVGLYSFVSPVSAARVYGIPVSPPAKEKQDSSDSTSASLSKDEAYVYAHGSRNLAIGTSILGLTACWRFSSICQLSPVAAQAVKRCLGITLLAGSMTPIADAYVISRYVGQDDISAQDVQTGKKASKTHAMRSLLWVVVALACLLT